jgi:protoporphyrinogen oxidase
MRYPKNGGYRSFIKNLAEKANIKLNFEVVEIDIENKIIKFTNNEAFQYNNLISSIPLPSLIKMIKNTPVSIKNAAEKLYATSVILVSIGFNKIVNFPSIWFYIYDDDIIFSRAYSPSLKSSGNAPKGKSSLQCEIYFSRHKPLLLNENEIKNKIITSLFKMKLCEKDDIEFIDLRKLQFGNVVFYKGMEDDRKLLLDYIRDKSIHSIGRFGEWDYLWSNQSFMSGYKAGIKINAL